jgi:hypothetical protein
MLQMAGGGQIPKYTLVAEIDDQVAFGKTLDNLMVAVNQQLKAQATEAAERAEAARAAEAPPGQGAAERTKEGRRRAPVAAPEFKLMPSRDTKERIYQFSVPTSAARSLPAGFRPTVRLGAKYLVLSTSPDSARQALDLKPGAWAPPSDLSATFNELPAGLIYLAVDDPRPTTPEVLASLPANLQRGVNTAITMARASAAAGATPEQAAFFNAKVRPILADTCQKCHGAKKQSGGLRLDSREALLAGGELGQVVVPGDPENSLLIQAVRQTHKDIKMPAKSKPIPSDQIEALVTWVKMGVPWPKEGAAAGGAGVADAGPRGGGRGGPGGMAAAAGDGPGGMRGMTLSAPPGYGGGPPPGYPGGSSGAMMARGGGPGAAEGAGGEGDAAAAMLTFNIDPDKLPKADDLRSKLFPGAMALAADDQEIKVVTRAAFPSVVAPASAMGMAVLMPAIQSARTAAAAAAARNAGAAGAPAAPGAPPPAAPAAPAGADPPGRGRRPGAPGDVQGGAGATRPR